MAFDGFVDAFESANFERHRAGKFFQHVFQVLKIAAHEELRLFGRDIECVSLRVDGVGDFFHGRLEA